MPKKIENNIQVTFAKYEAFLAWYVLQLIQREQLLKTTIFPSFAVAYSNLVVRVFFFDLDSSVAHFDEEKVEIYTNIYSQIFN